MRRGAWLLLAAALGAHAEEAVEFDVGAFEKKPFEWSGFLELRPEYQWLDRDAALYGLQFPGDTRDTQARTAAAAEVTGIYRHGDLRLHATAHASYLNDAGGASRDFVFYELYGAWQPASGAGLEAGKRTLRWGKGYAWNPVAFFERLKDPTDPELAREGFVLAGAELVRSADGALKTLSFTPLLLPVTDELNEDYGPPEHWNAGARLYALLLDTDIDLLYAAPGSRGARWGADFSRNLGTNLEVHGEWARVTGAPRPVLTPVGTLAREERDYTSYLLGLRYLTGRETTILLEYYRNGAGYTEEELAAFFELAGRAAADPLLAPIAAQAAGGGYNRPNPGRNYYYLRLSQPEPFDVLYFTPALTAIVNRDDGSYTLIPELAYTGITNVELRLRAQLNRGERLSEFGEKPVDERLELRLRYFF
jgi:hypothetical protein